MDGRLRDLYALPDDGNQQEIYLQDLSLQCAHLEERVRHSMESMPISQRQLLEDYIAVRDELEFQSVKRALRFGKVKTSG